MCVWDSMKAKVGRLLSLRSFGVSMKTQYCPRCRTAILTETDHAENIRFFLCSNCNRRYALQPGQALTSRWREAITLPLHEVCQSKVPIQHALRVARKFVSQWSSKELDWIVQEIKLELDDPTQRVRDTLDCNASEVELRQYLLLFCEHVEQLRRHDPGATV